MEELISSAHARCFVAFNSLLNVLQQPEINVKEQNLLTIINNEFDKYKIWVGNVGAAHFGKRYEISLEYRLREASFLKELVIRLLSSLEQRLSAAQRMVQGRDLLPRQESERITDSNSESTGSSDSGESNEEEVSESEDSPWDISDSDSGDGPSPQQQQLRPASGNLESIGLGSHESQYPRLIESIQTIIISLYRLPIRRPAPLDRIKHSTSIDTAMYQHFDVLYVQDKFPNLSSEVATRLGKMITRRRQILYYRDTHRRNLDPAWAKPHAGLISESSSTFDGAFSEVQDQSLENHDIEDEPRAQPMSQAASSHFTLRSKATTVKPEDQETPDLQVDPKLLYASSIAESKSSMASSYTGENLNVKVPARPKNSAGQELEQFECPYCCITITISSDRKWKKHVLGDLQPYVCTYEGCGLYDHMFDSRDDWYKHEMQNHRTKWSCHLESHPEFELEQDFLLHMRSKHSHNFDEAQFSVVQSTFRRPTKNLDGTCNLCLRASKKLRSHVSKHLQQIAIFALPRVNEVSGSDQGERNSSLSEPGSNSFDSKSSGSSSNFSKDIPLGQQDGGSDAVSDHVEDDFDVGDDIPDAEDQNWDNFIDKFSIARARTFRRLRVLIHSEGRQHQRIMLLVQRLQCEAVFSFYTNPVVAARHDTKPDIIIIDHPFLNSPDLVTMERQLRDVTDVPIIIISQTASELTPSLDSLSCIGSAKQDDIKTAFESLCDWAPAPYDRRHDWRQEAALHTTFTGKEHVLSFMKNGIIHHSFDNAPQKFLPWSVLDQIATYDVISRLSLEDWKWGYIPGQDYDPGRIYCTGRKLFAACIFAGLPLEFLRSLLDQGLTDSDFPLLSGQCPRYRVTRTSFEQEFVPAQKILTTAYFRRGSFQKLEQNAVIPIDYSKTAENILAKRSSSSVYSVKIHRDHREFGRLHEDETFAMKVKPLIDRHGVKQVTARPSHPHLLRAFASFSFEEKLYIIYEKAQFNLDDFIQHALGAGSRDNWVEADLAEQLYGLASALSALHYSSHSSTMQPIHLLDMSLRHILVFIYPENSRRRYVLRLSDRSNESGCRKRSYNGPLTFKGLIPGSDRVPSKVHDTWTLGCIWMELIVWYKEGYAALLAFRNARMNESDPESSSDDRFFTLRPPQGAKLRESVEKKMDEFKTYYWPGPALQVIAGIITSMLETDTRNRPTAHELVRYLDPYISEKDVTFSK